MHEKQKQDSSNDTKFFRSPCQNVNYKWMHADTHTHKGKKKKKRHFTKAAQMKSLELRHFDSLNTASKHLDGTLVNKFWFHVTNVTPKDNIFFDLNAHSIPCISTFLANLLHIFALSVKNIQDLLKLTKAVGLQT